MDDGGWGKGGDMTTGAFVMVALPLLALLSLVLVLALR